MSTVTITHPSRAEWLAARRLGIGASDAAALYGESPWQSPLALYADKRGLTAVENENVPEFIKWGLKLEPVIAQEFGDETGREVVKVPPFTIERDLDHGCLFATPDGKQITTIGGQAAVGVLELKTTNQFKRADWQEGIPLYYQIQVQHQLMVTGLAYGSVAVLIGGSEFLWADVARNDGFIEDLRRRALEFWARVEAGEPPPADASEATKDALSRMYPKATSVNAIVLPAESDQWDKVRQEAKATIKAATERLNWAENNLKAAIGDKYAGVLADGSVYTWGEQTRKSYTVAATTFRVLRRKGD